MSRRRRPDCGLSCLMLIVWPLAFIIAAAKEIGRRLRGKGRRGRSMMEW